MTTRREYLEFLLQYDRPIKDITKALKTHGWDCDDELVALTSSHIRGVLSRFLAGNLVTADVEAWANAIEGRDDIGFDSEYEQFLIDVVFFLANPRLNEQLTEECAKRLMAELPNR